MDRALLKDKPSNSTSQEINGVDNWFKVMFMFFAIRLVIENYIEYGILVHPLEPLFNAFDFLCQTSYLFLIAFFYYLLQISNAYIIEKCLSRGSVSDNFGMALHGINAVSIALFIWLINIYWNFNGVYVKFIVTHFFMFPFKIWSFAVENRKFRLSYMRKYKETTANDKQANNLLLKYPENVTITNLVTYLIFTPPVLYRMEYPKRTKPNYQAGLKAIFRTLLLLYLLVFIFRQYLVGDLKKIRSYVAVKQYGLAISVFLRLIVPVEVFWFLYGSEYVFKTYLRTYGELTGMKYIVYQLDWWNSYTSSLFWSKWNIPMYTYFKEYFLKPLLKQGYGKLTSIFLVTCISGLVHEFILSIPFRAGYGLPFFFTFIQLTGHPIEEFLQKSVSHKTFMFLANCILWIYLFTIHVGFLLVFDI